MNAHRLVKSLTIVLLKHVLQRLLTHLHPLEFLIQHALTALHPLGFGLECAILRKEGWNEHVAWGMGACGGW